MGTIDPTENRQIAPYPQALADLVAETAYRPNWTVTLQDLDRGQGSEGLTLVIRTLGYDSYHPERGQTYGVYHYMPVPPAAYDGRTWLRWLFDQFCLVEIHEAMEFFAIQSQVVEVEDACAECEHRAGDHDGRDTSCASCTGDAWRHRFRPAVPRYERPYAPNHGPGRNPYTVHELGLDVDARTSFRGIVREPT